MKWGDDKRPMYGPWNIEPRQPGPSLAAFDKALKEHYLPGLKALMQKPSAFQIMLGREIAKAEDDIRTDLSRVGIFGDWQDRYTIRDPHMDRDR